MGGSWFGSPQSREEREREDQAFFRWAFPYGAAQRERVLALLERVLPRRRPQMALVIYLTAREAFWDREGLYAGIPGPDPADRAAACLRERRMGVPRQEIPVYVALVMADREVGEDLSYPGPEEILAAAEALSRRWA